MKKGINKRLIALVCALVLAFCDVGSVLAQHNVTVPVAEENEDGVVLPDDDLTETPDDGTTDDPEQPEHTHVYVETVTKEPTYTEKGEKTFACECGESYTEEIDILIIKNPTFEKVECVAKGIAFSWDAIEGATHYKIFRGKNSRHYWE